MSTGTGNETTNPKPKAAQKTKGYLKRKNQADLTEGQPGAEYIKRRSTKKNTMKIWNALPDNAVLGNATCNPESDDIRSKFLKMTPKVPTATHGHEENLTEQGLKQGPKRPPKKEANTTARHIAPSESNFAEKGPNNPATMKAQQIIRQISPTESSFAEKERERCKSLKARIKVLKEQNQNLRFQVEEEAELASQLKDANTKLLNDLRRKLPPDVIARLEAANPDRD
ncbi:OLC1v1003155C2 [Oldenlandia corymbosa var. corymbosa]|nr:OLC1v1003155C2 [Oldenlandia corymbosa var. corymbosa]